MSDDVRDPGPSVPPVVPWPVMTPEEREVAGRRHALGAARCDSPSVTAACIRKTQEILDGLTGDQVGVRRGPLHRCGHRADCGACRSRQGRAAESATDA